MFYIVGLEHSVLAFAISNVLCCILSIPAKMPYGSTTLEPMTAQNAMSTVSNGTGLHTRVGGVGYKRKGLGEGKGGRSCLEHLLQTVDINGKEVTSSRSHST